MPIPINTQSNSVIAPANVPSFTESNKRRHFQNGLKVSDVSYPMSFPTQATYRSGNGKILGLARLSAPMAQDNFGYFPLIAFCTDGIYVYEVDRTGNVAYSTNHFSQPDVCTNRDSICEIGGGVFFAMDKGLALFSNQGVKLYAAHARGKNRFLPSSTADPKSGRAVYHKMVSNSAIAGGTVTFMSSMANSLSYQDMVTYLNTPNTYVRYVSEKNMLLIYNRAFDYVYMIDFITENVTKLGLNIWFGNGNIPQETFWSGKALTGNTFIYQKKVLEYATASLNNLPCLLSSRPVFVGNQSACSYRVKLTGYFEGATGNWADLVVFGSLDGDHWRVIGVKEMKLEGGFHNIGCLTERGTWKYLRFVFAGKLTTTSHIDEIDIAIDKRYNNKLR